MKCKASKHAWSRWKDTGKPRAGPLFELMCSTKKDLRHNMSGSVGPKKREKIQTLDKLFKGKHIAQFYCPRSIVSCHRLIVNGDIITDRNTLLRCRKDHYGILSNLQSECSGCISSLLANSYGCTGEVLDVATILH